MTSLASDCDNVSSISSSSSKSHSKTVDLIDNIINMVDDHLNEKTEKFAEPSEIAEQYLSTDEKLEYAINTYRNLKDGNRRTGGWKIKYEVKNAKGKGFGVFATEFIPKGTMTYCSNHYLTFTHEEINKLLPLLKDDEERGHFLTHCYSYHDWPTKNVLLLNLDDSSFTNHSTEPPDEKGKYDFNYYASRNIYPGEELTEHYVGFANHDWYKDLTKHYSVLDHGALVQFVAQLEQQ